jgi:hypothetical protein
MSKLTAVFLVVMLSLNTMVSCQSSFNISSLLGNLGNFNLSSLIGLWTQLTPTEQGQLLSAYQKINNASTTGPAPGGVFNIVLKAYQHPEILQQLVPQLNSFLNTLSAAGGILGEIASLFLENPQLISSFLNLKTKQPLLYAAVNQFLVSQLSALAGK